MVRQGLQPLNYIDTWYRRGLTDQSERAPLAGREDADVCIVGGGLAGLTGALELARRGRRVCLLEAERIAWGASGRNGGFVSPGYSLGYPALARRLGVGPANALMRLSIEGAEAVAHNIEQLSIGEAESVPGILSVARHDSAVPLQAHRDWLEREFGYRLEFRTREQVQQVLRSPRYFQGLYNPQGFHMHPLNYARALAREAERLGTRIFEASRAVSLSAEGQGPGTGRVRVLGERGEVRARDVVIACGGYTDALVPALRSSYLPIATYVMLTRPDRARLETAVRTTAAIGDGRRAGDYYRLVDAGERLLWGGKITTRIAEPRRLARVLHATMSSTYPQLAALEVEIAWSGLMSYARHLMPQIGRLRPGVWYCTAFGGHGLNTTTIGGRLIAEGISGESDRYRHFAPFGLAWNGGIAGRAAVQATYWWLQAGDYLREHRAS
jgi:gamma-glutamylputrescine oxidase